MISAERWWTRFWAERSSSSSVSRLTGEVMELLEAGGRVEEKEAVLRHVQVLSISGTPRSLIQARTLQHHRDGAAAT